MTEMLKRVREITLKLRSLRQQMELLQPTPRSPRLDGMPHAAGFSGAGDAVDELIDARDEMAACIAAYQAELGELQRAVLPQLSRLPEQLLTFCLCYYIHAMPISEVAKRMDRTERRVYAYKRELQGTWGDRQEAHEKAARPIARGRSDRAM